MISTIKTGRPTVMTKEVLGGLRQAFLWGSTDEEASAYAGIARSTVSEYKARNKGFSDRVRAWKLNPILLAKKTVVEELSRNVKVAMWYLERRRPEEFGRNCYHEARYKPQVDISKVLDELEQDIDNEGVRELDDAFSETKMVIAHLH